MLETSLIATVAAVVREGSFDRAARALHVTPSAVSQRVRLLEERLGTVLVVRGQPCTPTRAGARLCRHAETVLLLEDALRRELPALQPATPAAGPATLRIAINADSVATWFMPAMQAFTAGEAGTLLDIAIDDQDRTRDWLQRGQVLAAASSVAKPVQGCRSRRLGVLRYCATATPAFAARWFEQGVTARALAGAPALVFDRNDRLQEQWVRRQVRRDVALSEHRLPSPAAFVEATLMGIGWGMNPLALVRDHLAAGRLVELVPGRPLDVPLYWHSARLPLPELDRLTREVARAAARVLSS
ncbi:MAG: LysR family transcriptional regulator ArgP [Burkholderiaceae bacterium]|nr:LysR family transcriptional regulator ArgP [Burkholderiaceae bacterium]